jgi:choline kinase
MMSSLFDPQLYKAQVPSLAHILTSRYIDQVHISGVSIAEPVEGVSPLIKGSPKPIDDDFQLDDRVTKQHRAKGASKLTGRHSTERLAKSRQGSLEFLADLGYESTASTRPNSIHDQDGLLSKVSAWLHQEKARRATSKAHRRAKKSSDQAATDHEVDGPGGSSERRASDASSEGSVSLGKLQELLASMSVADRSKNQRRHKPHRGALSKMLRRASTAASSDTEYVDGDAIVPTCEAILDNSKTLSYSGGGNEEIGEKDGSERPPLNRATSSMQNDAWKTFKYEIVRLAHTLRLKGWRKVSMEISDQITVERLSGALTNAVYVVSPPKEIPPKKSGSDDTTTPIPRKPPP